MRAAPAALLLLGACAAAPDRFYALSAVPPPAQPGHPTAHLRLDVTVPSLIDRPEMVVATAPNGILILEHERWAAPVSDQVTEVLARDIENERGDLIVADRRFDQASSPALLLKVDIVRMEAQRGGQAVLEAHWRIVDAGAGTDQLGASVQSTPVGADGYAAIPQAYSRLLGELAEKMAAGVRRQ
jgi:uncharacterized lipoprotein YmbA